MKPLIVLFSAFLLTMLVSLLIQGSPAIDVAGRVAITVMLVFTALGHFRYAGGMQAMLPDWMPAKPLIVSGTGFLEIAAAIAVHVTVLQVAAGWLLILFFVLVLPANIRAALLRLDYESGGTNGPGPRYLWFRIPMQLLLIAWVVVFLLPR